MADPLAKVKPGDPLAIPAPAYNAFVDAARDFQNRQKGAGAGMSPWGSSQTIVVVKNTGDVACPRFGVLAIFGPLIDPAASADAFTEQVAFSVAKPAGTGFEPFVVALEPIAVGAVGRAVGAGLAIVKVNFSDTGHKYARTVDDITGYLASCASASLDHTPAGCTEVTKGGSVVRIIWPDPAGATGEQYAIILMETPKPHAYVFDTSCLPPCTCGNSNGLKIDGQGRVLAIRYPTGTSPYFAWYDLAGNKL